MCGLGRNRLITLNLNRYLSTEYPRKGIDTDAILSVRVYMWENDYTMYAWLEEVNNDGELGRRRLIIKS